MRIGALYCVCVQSVGETHLVVVKRLWGDCDVVVKCCIGHWCGGKNIGEGWGHHHHGVGHVGQAVHAGSDFVLMSRPPAFPPSIRPTPSHVANSFAVEMGFKEESLDTNASMCVPLHLIVSARYRQL